MWSWWSQLSGSHCLAVQTWYRPAAALPHPPPVPPPLPRRRSLSEYFLAPNCSGVHVLIVWYLYYVKIRRAPRTDLFTVKPLFAGLKLLKFLTHGVDLSQGCAVSTADLRLTKTGRVSSSIIMFNTLPTYFYKILLKFGLLVLKFAKICCHDTWLLFMIITCICYIN